MADPVSIGLNIATTLFSASSSLAEGDAAEASAKYTANTQMARGTRKASDAKREGDIMISNARAAMAANGGVANDVGAIDGLSAIERDSLYNSQLAFTEAQSDYDITRYEGKLKKKAAKNKAIGTVLSGGSRAYKSYKSR